MENRRIEELEDEIKVLEKRLSRLEGAENRRKIKKWISILFKFIILCCVVYGLVYAYNYVTVELPNHIIPNYINNTIDKINPFK